MVIIPRKHKNLAIRFYANLIDYGIYYALFFVYLFAVGTPDENGTYSVHGLKALVLPLVWIIYFPVCESITGQTLGKKAFDLYVVDISGEVPGFGQALIRRLLDVGEMITFGVMAMLTINYSAKSQRLGDMMAGTTVVSTMTVCRFCHANLELNFKEISLGCFICPNCHLENRLKDEPTLSSELTSRGEGVR